MYDDIFVDRLIQLRNVKGVSARDMSLSIGQNTNYINQIENRKAFPTMQAFFYICDYLDITPSEFFDTENVNPKRTGELFDSIKRLGENQRSALAVIISELQKSK